MQASEIQELLQSKENQYLMQVSEQKMHVIMILILDRDWYWMILGNCAESFHLSILVQ